MDLQGLSIMPGGGALILESGTGMRQGHDPLFSGQSAKERLPIYHQCATPIISSHFKFLEFFSFLAFFFFFFLAQI